MYFSSWESEPFSPSLSSKECLISFKLTSISRSYASLRILPSKAGELCSSDTYTPDPISSSIRPRLWGHTFGLLRLKLLPWDKLRWVTEERGCAPRELGQDPICSVTHAPDSSLLPPSLAFILSRVDGIAGIVEVCKVSSWVDYPRILLLKYPWHSCMVGGG